MTSLDFMINIPSPGEKGSKQHGNRAPVRLTMMMTTTTTTTTADNDEGNNSNSHQYIFPSHSDSGSVIYFEENQHHPQQQSQQQQNKEKLSASRLRSLRRNRLIRDNHGTTTLYGEGESKEEQADGYSSSSDDVVIHDHLSTGIASSDPTVGYRNVSAESHQEYLRIKRQRELIMTQAAANDEQQRSKQQNQSSHNDNDSSYYHRLETVMKEFSTMMELIAGGWWCASNNSEVGGNEQPNDEAFLVVGSTTFHPPHQFHRHQEEEEEEDEDENVVVASSTFQSDPFDIIQDPQVAAIMKKNRLRYQHHPNDMESDVTHLRALEIVAKNKHRTDHTTRHFPEDESSMMGYLRSHPAM